MKQILTILLAATFCPIFASAQGAQRISTALGNVGGNARILAYAQVQVCAYQSIHPFDCSTGITLYQDPALTMPYPSNPIQADQNGNYSYYVAPGNYVEQVCAVGANCQTHTITLGGGGSGGDVSSIFGRQGSVTAQTGDYTAAQVTNAADKSASSNVFNGSLTGAQGVFVGTGANQYRFTATSGFFQLTNNANTIGIGVLPVGTTLGYSINGVSPTFSSAYFNLIIGSGSPIATGGSKIDTNPANFLSSDNTAEYQVLTQLGSSAIESEIAQGDVTTTVKNTNIKLQGATTVNGELVCTADGTNCPSSSSDLSVLPTGATIGGTHVCLTDGTNCPSPPPTAAVPTFSPIAGTYTSTQTVTLTDTTSGAIISYCVNVTGNCTPNTVYSVALTVATSETICANAVAVSGGVVSDTSCNSYIINSGSPSAPTNTGIGTILFQSVLTDGTTPYKTCFVTGTVCSGGVGSITPAATPTHTFALNTPTANTGTANAVGNFHLEASTTSGFTEALWTTTGGGVGANAAPTNFYVGGRMKANFAAGAWRLEFDPYAFDSGWDWMFGTQCNGDNNLIQTANQSSSWSNTPAQCGKLHDGNYHFVEMTFHRTLGADRSCAGGTAPCATWDAICIDGTCTALNVTMPATASSWTGSGWQMQIDGKPTTASSGSHAIYDLWCDTCQFLAGTAASGSSPGGNGAAVAAGTGELDSFSFDSGTPSGAGLTAVGSPTVGTSVFNSSPNGGVFAAGNNYFTDTLSAPTKVLYTRQYVQITSIGSTSNAFLRLYHGSAEMASFFFSASTGNTSVFNQAANTTTTLQASAYPLGSLHRIETFIKIDPTAGQIIAKIDGTTVFTSAPTLNTGNTTVDTVWFGQIGNSAPVGWGTTYQDNVDFSALGFLGPI